MDIEKILSQRLSLILQIQQTFERIYRKDANMLKRGECQTAILDALDLPKNRFNRKMVNETMNTLGYRHIKTNGHHYFKRK